MSHDAVAVWTGAPNEGVRLETGVVPATATATRLARGVRDAFNRPLLETLARRRRQ